MKHIKKNAEPQGFIDWKAANWEKIKEKNDNGATGNDLWEILPSSRSAANMPNEYSKADLRTAIASEQFHLCCYCMFGIKAQPSDTKMEHFLPKEVYKPDEVFDYKNLLTACNGGEKTRPVELSCDSEKGAKNPNKENNRIISPLSEDCEKHFDYKENGEIIGLTAEGNTTIKNLNLNCKRLKILRQQVLESYIFDVWQEDMTTNIEIENVLTPYFDGDKSVLQPFCMAIVAVLRHYP
jgi:uncharacterized protein (TIGR02646 family)